MHRRFTALSFILFLALCASTSRGVLVSNPIVINPHDDGHFRATGVGGNYSYLNVDAGGGEDIRGIAEFSLSAITGPVSSATLSVNPYGLPIYGLGIDVYAYPSNDGTVTFSDYSAGTFIGHWNIPDTLGFGQDTFFDVTPFLRSLTSPNAAPYVGFTLRTPNGGYQFSSLEYNYGHPAQLTVTIPEPSALAAAAPVLSLALTVLHRRRR
jgi:hypothetical protein